MKEQRSKDGLLWGTPKPLGMKLSRFDYEKAGMSDQSPLHWLLFRLALRLVTCKICVSLFYFTRISNEGDEISRGGFDYIALTGGGKSSAAHQVESQPVRQSKGHSPDDLEVQAEAEPGQ